MKLAALLLVAASAQTLVQTSSQGGGVEACRAATGVLLVTADNGLMLVADKTKYEVFNIPKKLYGPLNANLQNQIDGTFDICPTAGRDRFGNQIVNIKSVGRFTVIPPSYSY